MSRDIPLLLFVFSTLVYGFSYFLSYLEKRREDESFRSGYQVTKNFFIHQYFINKKHILFRIGYEFTVFQIVMMTILSCALFGFLPLFLHQPFSLVLFFVLIGFLVFDFLTRWYGNRFQLRFERGLMRSALPIGIESLTALSDTHKAILDVLELSDDILIRREFTAILTTMGTLNITVEDAMVFRSNLLNMTMYKKLAQYTVIMSRYGCKTDESWKDILEELEDRELLRTSIRAKTAMIKNVSYGFLVVFLLSLLIFFHYLVPIMKGSFPFILVGIIVLIFIGVYRISQIGGDHA